MAEQSRVQVRKDDVENTWADVGNKAGNEKVPVTIGAGGGAGLTGTELNTDPFYHVNNWETVGDITYVGEESNDSQWRVTQLTKSTGVVHYATIFNNMTTLTYVTAWAGRALLVYGDFATS